MTMESVQPAVRACQRWIAMLELVVAKKYGSSIAEEVFMEAAARLAQLGTPALRAKYDITGDTASDAVAAGYKTEEILGFRTEIIEATEERGRLRVSFCPFFEYAVELAESLPEEERQSLRKIYCGGGLERMHLAYGAALARVINPTMRFHIPAAMCSADNPTPYCEIVFEL